MTAPTNKIEAKKIVGVKSNNYPEQRNFSGLVLSGFEFEKKIDLYKFPAFLYFKLRKKTHLKLLNLFWNFGWSNAKLYHFFNAVNCGNQPWVVTFEYYIPFGAYHMGNNHKDVNYIEFAMRRLAHPSCKKIIAISNFAKEAQKKYAANFPEFSKVISDKIEVWLPPQKLMIEHISEKLKSEKLKFVFVGADFFRKGGMEVLIVFDELLKSNPNLELHIVSKMLYGDHASLTTLNDQLEAKKIIQNNPQIQHVESLSNDEVINLLKSCEVALLPTYDDTFGYFVLEAQACGCPVISTNGSALTEINNNHIGWVIEVPLVEDGRSIPRNSDEKKVFREIVVSEMKQIVKQVILNPEIISEKGERCLERIREYHNVERSKLRLESLYEKIISE